MKFLRLALTFLVVNGFLGPSPTFAKDRNALWDIVSDCVNPEVSERGPCDQPREDSVSAADPRCMITTQVWAQSEHYVAIRDEKMCNCPPTFVHGLALPFAKLSGTEADDLPEGIWAFAWAAARERIADESAIALVVNPPAHRTQDQLHIHLVRLRDDARAAIAKHSTVTVPSLNEVWKTARRVATERHQSGYGVVVTRGAGNAFSVLVSDADATPEITFTRYRCR